MAKYGLKVSVTRNDLPDIELNVTMPEVDRDYVAAHNPALAAVFENFDKAVAGLPAEILEET